MIPVSITLVVESEIVHYLPHVIKMLAEHFRNIFSVACFYLYLFRRVVVRLVPGMSSAQKGKCWGTHPFVGFQIQSAHRQQYSRPDTSSTSFPETYLTSKVIPGCCTPYDMGITILLPNLPALQFILLGRPGMSLDAFLHWPQLHLKP